MNEAAPRFETPSIWDDSWHVPAPHDQEDTIDIPGYVEGAIVIPEPGAESPRGWA